jgi:hypothetical protein
MIAAALILAAVMSLSSCTRYASYKNSDLMLAFVHPAKYPVMIDDNSVLCDLSKNVYVVLFSNDISSVADERYTAIYSQNELGLHSGAFESNYDNTLFVSQLFDYLFSDAQNNYQVYGLHQGTFGAYDAWCATFASEDAAVNGYIYLCVENLRSYIICIYVKNEDIHTDHNRVDKFIDSFTIISQ